MTVLLRAIDERLDRLGRAEVFALAVSGVLIVGGIDYVTGSEVSIGLLYLGPLAVGAWYAGRRIGIAIAIMSCATWYAAEIAVGGHYSHPAIPVWNALVRFGFFLITAVLLTALRKSLLTQQQLARTDALTGLCSRRAFEERLEHDLALAQRRKSPLTLSYVDLDGFKAVNDTRGHAEGDRVLRVVGQSLKDAIRETDTAARIGGDEFALILPDTDDRGARQAISKLTRELHKSLAASNCGISCSIGAVTYLDAATSPENALAAADKLMYEAKHSGKGAVAFSVLGEAIQPGAAADAPQATPR